MDANRKVILIDHRWGSNPQWRDETAAELRELGYEPVVRQLDVGDFMWGSPHGRVGVELKGVNDLLRSHQNGRLDDELYRLQRAAAVPILLIYGALGSDVDVPPVAGFTWHAVDNMLLGRQLRGILVARTGDSTIAKRIASIEQYLSRSVRRTPRRAPHFPYMGPMTDRAEVVYALLSTAKGIRNKAAIAEKLAANYTLSEIFTWDEAAWRAQGFTKLMARRLAGKLRESL